MFIGVFGFQHDVEKDNAIIGDIEICDTQHDVEPFFYNWAITIFFYYGYCLIDCICSKPIPVGVSFLAAENI